MLLLTNRNGGPALSLVRMGIVWAQYSVPLRRHEHFVRGNISQKNLQCVSRRAVDSNEKRRGAC